jgi:hypothetical protein
MSREFTTVSTIIVSTLLLVSLRLLSLFLSLCYVTVPFAFLVIAFPFIFYPFIICSVQCVVSLLFASLSYYLLTRLVFSNILSMFVF